MLPESVEYEAKKLREAAELLENMAGVYPGDITGNISRDAFLYYVMAEVLEEFDWDEQLEGYEADRPKIEVTMYDQAGNVVAE